MWESNIWIKQLLIKKINVLSIVILVGYSKNRNNFNNSKEICKNGTILKQNFGIGFLINNQ